MDHWMTDQQSTADHWWWRPGWSTGRRFLTWHLTFDHALQVHRLAEAYRQRLATVPGLDLIPNQWLHLTMQGLGFVDEVAQDDVEAIVAIARAQLALVPAFDVTIDRPAFTPEAIRWEAAPREPVEAVRDAIRTAIGTVWAEVPEQRDGFGPHISIAYSNAALPAGPVLAAIAAEPSEPASARIASAELILLERDNQMYEWETVASLPLA
ncbi:2'-5' RNA ligase family protein [Streptacidiphilus cavernicola]|uniref:2'-5' RNA ligase family protein n=1 Tax=Streptacidiphilus cavernicola TaxID=3342716 RepID=A0ABV6VXY0_9ACTN